MSNLTNSDNQFIFTDSSNSLNELRSLHDGIITIVVAILLNQRSIVAKKNPSILIKLLADQQWCCSFVWNIQKKVIWDSAQSEIDCLIEWYSMGSFSYFLYICLVRDTKKPIILCSQYYGNDEHWLQRLFGTTHRIQPILDWAEQKKNTKHDPAWCEWVNTFVLCSIYN